MNGYESQIEKDLIWREKELASLKRIAITNRDNAIAYRTILRASWATLYAHFEGFTKFAWELLFDNVESEGIAVGELCDEFKILALEKAFKELRSDTGSENLLSFFETGLSDFLESKVRFDDECRLSTESNLWPNVFERECAKVGIRSIELENVRQRIRTLVARRNDIAHGKDMTIGSIEEYSDYEQAVLLVMHDLAIQIIDLLDGKTYQVSHKPLQPIDNASAD